MDHIGKKARVESAYLVQDKMKELGKGKELPAILTGDFNVDQTHQSYDAFVSKGVLCDSYEKCDFRYATTEHSMISIRTVLRKAASTMYSSLLFSK